MNRSRNITIVTTIILIILVCLGFYWYFFLKTPSSNSRSENSASNSTGFTPYGRAPVTTTQPTTTGTSTNTSTSTATSIAAPIPTLRLLSSTPIGGYGASTTASTTIVRWVDRGRGNIYEADENSLNIVTLSNTLLPRVFMSVWNKNLTALIGSLYPDQSEIPNTVYATLVPQNIPKTTGTSSLNSNVASLAPYALRGSTLPNDIIGYAESPKKDKIFFMVDQNGEGVGYISSTNGSNMVQLFTTPLTQVNVDWPATNIISITTKGSADQGGYLYFVNPTTGAWTKILGPIAGLSAKVSHDGKYALVSVTGTDSNILTSIYNIQKGTGTDAVIRTLADKCAWGNFYTNLVYCGVPTQQITGTYPDDWYKGNISFVDKIWQVNADTGEIHQVSTLVDQSDRLIDAFNLDLDPKDNYLFFMDKNDLSFWSLDLVGSNSQ